MKRNFSSRFSKSKSSYTKKSGFSKAKYSTQSFSKHDSNAPKVIIVESPTKVKKISQFLPRDFKVVATGGHVRDLPEDSMGISIDELKKGIVRPQWEVIRGKWKFIKRIREVVKNASDVFIATDPDREGEAIGWHISQLLKISDPKRITFHEITRKAVLSALANPGKIDMKLVSAQLSRRILDRIVGYTLSPVFWRIRKNSSAGRVQSATLYLVVKRWEEHKNFKPQPYWILKFLGKGFSATLWEKDKDGKEKKKIFWDFDEARDFSQRSVALEVLSVRRWQSKISPPAPYNTPSLLQDAKKILGWSSDKTMKIAQMLFENGLITYHRTDSVTLSDEALQMAQNWLSQNKPHLAGSPRQFKTRVANAQEAHEAIRPTEEGLSKISAFVLSQKDPDFEPYKLLKLITLRFLASQSKPEIREYVEVRFKVHDLPENFFALARAYQVKFLGFKEIFGFVEEKDDEDVQPTAFLLSLERGQVISDFKKNIEKHMTEPPPLYTEATLIKTMEKLGIGRPSTYATIISTLKRRGYIKEEKGKLIPTEAGIYQTKLLEKNFTEICLPDFTAKMEEALDMIARGEIDWKDWLAKFTTEYESKFNEFKRKVFEEVFQSKQV